MAIAPDLPSAQRLAFGIWTESRGYNYANDGRNTSNSPGFKADTAAILRRSLDIPHDLVGSNGRSTGILQQTSSEVGGVWGSMVGTMTPAVSAQRFLDELSVTNDRLYVGTLLTPTGSKKVTVTLSDAIAADVLRIQQPLADEAVSSNYDASQVLIAKEIAAKYFTPQEDWIDMATPDEVKKAFGDALKDADVATIEGIRHIEIAAAPLVESLTAMAVRILDVQTALRPVKGYGDDPINYPYTQAFETLANRVYELTLAVKRIEEKLEAK